MKTTHWMTAAVMAALALAVACGPSVNNDEQARRAYLGLDKMISKSLALGFKGFNEAGSANIPTQQTTGDDGGTLTITGQVDQGASANKGMRLLIALNAYSDGPVVLDGGEKVTIIYHTDAGVEPQLNLSLRNIPDGTVTGSGADNKALLGDFAMDGDLQGSVHLDLSLSGQIESAGDGGTRRKVGTTTITGTATNPAGGTYNVNLTL
jgi:hypothetical protein